MDSSYRDIPIVEDDMGEGFMDPIEEKENLKEKLLREQWKAQERILKHFVDNKRHEWKSFKGR